jgi:hypothetical protein
VPPPPLSGTYTVVAGDGWFAIARKLGVSVSALLAANPPATINTVLHPGDVLNVPGGAATLATIGVLDMIPVMRRSNGEIRYTLDFKSARGVDGDTWQALIAAGAVDVKTKQKVSDAGQVTQSSDAEIASVLGPFV